jgi:putative holliday junction resolvase
MGSLIGIDYGAKRIGLAVGDQRAGIASPLVVVQARGDLALQAQSVLQAAADYDVDAFVVGLPLNMDDTEGPAAKAVRQFGAELAKQSNRPVHYFDERLSSVEADERMRPAELSRKKRKATSDAVAAQVILQGYLDVP